MPWPTSRPSSITDIERGWKVDTFETNCIWTHCSTGRSRRIVRGDGTRRGAKEHLETAGTGEGIPPVTAPSVVVAEAKVVPVQSAVLGLSTGGVVSEILVNEGDIVKEGALLLRVDDARQRAGVAHARAELQKAEAALAQAKSAARPQEIEAATAAVDAARAQLTKVKVAGPPLDVTIAESELRRAEAQLELLMLGERPELIAVVEADVAAARAALLQAEAALKETELRAPFSGEVAAVVPKVGEHVAPGSSLVWLADSSIWQIETEDLTELGIVRVQKGAEATITVDALPDLELTGRVRSIKPLGESKLGDITYQVVIELDQNDPHLRWNMTASVTIHE